MTKFKLDKIIEFEWDEANINHIIKHNVVVNEAEDIFFDPDNVLHEDINHSIAELRFLIIGKTRKGRLLYEIFTIRKKKIRIISSRDINKRELSLYLEDKA